MSEEEKGEATASDAPPTALPKAVEPLPPTPGPAPTEDWATRFKYLLADFENFRRRAAREHESTRRSVRAELILGLLPLYEAAARARDATLSMPPDDPIRRGVELLAREWSAFLEGEKVRPLARAGDVFRAEQHEAIAEAPPRTDAPAGTIVEVVQQGYRLENLVLRPAKVVVARAPHETGPTGPASASVRPDTTEDQE